MFLHGLMGSANNWRRVTPEFEADFHILLYDQRGHGRSFQPEQGYRPLDYAQDLHQILDELKWKRTALVGHSMGGRNALEFASHFSQRVTALVLEDIGPDTNAAAATRIERLLNEVPTPFSSREEARRFFAQEYPNRIRWYPQAEVVSRFLHSNLETKDDGRVDWRFAKSAVLQSLTEGRREDRWEALAHLKMPCLFIRGEHSQDLSPSIFARMLQVQPQAQGVEVPGAGHWVHFDQPESFVQAVKRFFASTLMANL